MACHTDYGKLEIKVEDLGKLVDRRVTEMLENNIATERFLLKQIKAIQVVHENTLKAQAESFQVLLQRVKMSVDEEINSSRASRGQLLEANILLRERMIKLEKQVEG